MPSYNESNMPNKGGFPIPDAVRDLWNKVYRKVASLYTRRHEPKLMIPIYKEFQYRGVPLKKIYQVIVVYDDPTMQTEIHTAHRVGAHGALVKVTRILTDQTLDELGVSIPEDSVNVGLISDPLMSIG